MNRRNWREWTERCSKCNKMGRFCQSKGKPESKPPYWRRTDGKLLCGDCSGAKDEAKPK